MRAHNLVGLPLALVATLCAQERPQYPEGAPVPRNLTTAETQWLRTHPLRGPGPLGITPAPTGPVHCVAEYEPMAGILLAWEGLSTWNDIQKLMAKEITTVGNADVHVVCDTPVEAQTAVTALQAAGANMARVKTVVIPTDTIWIRDYGPRYVFEGDCRVIVDHTYNRPRPADDVLPKAFGALAGHGFYEHQLIHGGGNYHLDALARAYATRLIGNENPGLSESQIVAIWKLYQNVDTTLFNPFRTSIDLTQHLDMWVQVCGDQTVVVSTWPGAATLPEAVLCDQTAAWYQQKNIQVFRTPAFAINGTHYTYTNVVICNGLVLIPSYTHPTVAPYNAQALAAWQQALPNHTIRQIPCETLVIYAGVLHCIAMHLPKARGNGAPTAYLKSPNGGERLLPNSVHQIAWISDDDQAVATVDLLLSLDGGQSYPVTLASQLPPIGTHPWTVPDVCTGMLRLKVVARDAQNQTGSDASDGNFAIAGTGCRAANVPYGLGKAGTLGVPALSAPTLPKIPSLWQLDLANAMPNAPAFTLFGLALAALPFDGGTLLVQYAGHIPVTTSATGSHQLSLPIPDDVALFGVSLYWQTWIPNDPLASGAGWAASQGLQMRLGN